MKKFLIASLALLLAAPAFASGISASVNVVRQRVNVSAFSSCNVAANVVSNVQLVTPYVPTVQLQAFAVQAAPVCQQTLVAAPAFVTYAAPAVQFQAVQAYSSVALAAAPCASAFANVAVHSNVAVRARGGRQGILKRIFGGRRGSKTVVRQSVRTR